MPLTVPQRRPDDQSVHASQVPLAGLAWQGFDTRREAMEALTLALHLDGA
jgi:hypothetical protein